MTKKVLGVRIDSLNINEAKQKVRNFLSSTKQHRIFTPNPEILVKAKKDNYFKDVLNSGDLNICDGFGLSLISGVERIPGVDFMLDICRIAEKNNNSIFLLGSGKSEVVEKTSKELKKRFPSLKIAGMSRGPTIKENSQNGIEINHMENYNTIAEINGAEPDILFVAFGMGKQEKWIAENLHKMPSVKIAMGVGGSFDFISGTIKRAPCWMRKIGLEWVYRLIKQPSRFLRIINATITFTYLAFKEKIL